MNVFTVVAYRYDTAIHCTICAENKFGLNSNLEISGVDSSGKEIQPVFLGDQIDISNCQTCGRRIVNRIIH